MERIVASNKGVVKAKVNNVLDLIHDASTFRPSASNMERVDIQHRGYAILTGVEPTAGIVRIINKKDGIVEDYLVVYPFTTLKPNINFFGLGRAKLDLNEEKNLDAVIEYDERIQLKGESLEDITLGAGIGNLQIKEAYQQLLEEKDLYPELYEKVVELVGENNSEPEVALLRKAFQLYAQENPSNIKDLKALGLKVKSPEDFSIDADFDTVKYFLDRILRGEEIGKVDMDDKYEIRFLPTNLIETGALYEQETGKIYEIISFFPERIRLETGRAIAQRLNSKDPLYATRMVLLNILNRNVFEKIKQGNEELYGKIQESLNKLLNNENIPEKGRQLIEKILEVYSQKKFDVLEKMLKKMWVENKRIFEEVMLSSPIVNIDTVLKQTPKGTYFLSNPLANRGYSLVFAKKLFDASKRFKTLEEDQSQLLLATYINLPRLLIQDGKLKVERVYKPYAVIDAIYDKENLEVGEIAVYKSKPEYIFDKWDRRIAGAIAKRNKEVLEMLKREIVENEKSLSTIYPKLIDEAIMQIENGEEFTGVVKEYLEEVEEAKKELSRVRGLLRNEENLGRIVEKFIKIKTIIETVPFEDIPPEKEALREMKTAYWHSIGLMKEIRKSLYYSLEKLQEPQTQNKLQEEEDIDIELEGFDELIKHNSFEEIIKNTDDIDESEENEDIDLDFLFEDEEQNKEEQNKRNKPKM